MSVPTAAGSLLIDARVALSISLGTKQHTVGRGEAVSNSQPRLVTK